MLSSQQSFFFLLFFFFKVKLLGTNWIILGGFKDIDIGEKIKGF